MTHALSYEFWQRSPEITIPVTRSRFALFQRGAAHIIKQEIDGIAPSDIRVEAVDEPYSDSSEVIMRLTVLRPDAGVTLIAEVETLEREQAA